MSQRRNRATSKVLKVRKKRIEDSHGRFQITQYDILGDGIRSRNAGIFHEVVNEVHVVEPGVELDGRQRERVIRHEIVAQQPHQIDQVNPVSKLNARVNPPHHRLIRVLCTSFSKSLTSRSNFLKWLFTKFRSDIFTSLIFSGADANKVSKESFPIFDWP